HVVLYQWIGHDRCLAAQAAQPAAAQPVLLVRGQQRRRRVTEIGQILGAAGWRGEHHHQAKYQSVHGTDHKITPDIRMAPFDGWHPTQFRGSDDRSSDPGRQGAAMPPAVTENPPGPASSGAGADVAGTRLRCRFGKGYSRLSSTITS